MTVKLIKDRETEVRPLVEGCGRRIMVVRGIDGTKWIVRCAMPDGKGGSRGGQRVYDTEAEAVADYDAMVAKIGGPS